MNKKILFIVIGGIMVLGSVLGFTIFTKKEGCSISNTDMACGNKVFSSNNDKLNIINGDLKSKMELYGKPTFLRRAGKFCAYCRDKLPEVEKLIFEPYKDKINIQIMTMDIQKSPFDTLIPQSPFNTFNFKDFVGKDCDTFPTWVVLDSQGELMSMECGGKTTIQEVAEEIKDLL